MELDLKDRVAMVAGSSRGIGRAIAETLLSEGARVCLSGRDATALNATADALIARYTADCVLPCVGDLTDVGVVRVAIDEVIRKWDGIDILVANLGSGAGRTGWDPGEEEWERLFRVNFSGSVRLAQAIIPEMMTRGGGTILFVSSIAGIESSTAPLPYCTAKSALIHYSKNLSRSVAAYGIRVNTIAPGNIYFPGGSWERRLEQHRAEVERYLATEVPMGRFGTPDDVAAMAAFLCSSQSSFCTGGNYVVDGGQTRSI